MSLVKEGGLNILGEIVLTILIVGGGYLLYNNFIKDDATRMFIDVDKEEVAYMGGSPIGIAINGSYIFLRREFVPPTQTSRGSDVWKIPVADVSEVSIDASGENSDILSITQVLKDGRKIWEIKVKKDARDKITSFHEEIQFRSRKR